MTRFRFASRAAVGCTTAVLCLASACSSHDADRTSSPDAGAQEAHLARPRLPEARRIDLRHPARLVPVPAAVVVADIPVRADAGVPVTTKFSTRPDASCQLAVSYERDDAVTRTAPAIADRLGIVSWTWTPKRGVGDALLHVVCSGGEQTAARLAVD